MRPTALKTRAVCCSSRVPNVSDVSSDSKNNESPVPRAQKTMAGRNFVSTHGNQVEARTLQMMSSHTRGDRPIASDPTAQSIMLALAP